MDQRQLIRFVLVAGIAFVAMTLLQPLLFPPQKNPAPNPPAEVARTDENGVPPAEQGLPQDNSDQAAAATESSKADPTTAAATDYPDTEPNRLVALGGFGPDHPDKLLVTLDSRGGSVRRIELNSRFPTGKLRYYDQETRGGYLGYLDLTPEANGSRVNFVGPGTPAATAGIQVGDVLTAVDGEPIFSPDDFATWLEKRGVGQSIQLTFRRGSGENAVEETRHITLAQKPLEVIGPGSGQLFDRESKKPASYLTTLRKKVDQAVWPELDPQLTRVNWQTRELEVDGTRVVEFSHVIPADVLAAQGLSGPLKIVKRYWLPEPTSLDDFARNYHVNMQVEIQNLSETPVTAALEIDGPTGTNIEGWWYQNKIHGRTSAVGYIAGARDVVGGSDADGFVFWGNAEIVKNYLASKPVLQAVLTPTATGNALHFIGVDTLYFVSALIPDAEGRSPGQASNAPPAPFQPYSAFVNVVDFPQALRDNRRLQKTTDVSFRLFSDELTLPPKSPDESEATPLRQTFALFAGPKEPQLLQKYQVANQNNLSEVVTYGWFAPFSKPLVALLRFFYSIVHSYGLAIIMLTVIVRLLLMPISRRVAMNAQTSAKMMQTLQPEIKRLSERYKDDLEKRMRAQQELFAKHGFNPLKQQFGGCLLVFLQLPIFIGLYRGLSVDVALRGQPLFPRLQWCSDLAAPDQLLYWKDWMPGFLAGETSWFGPYLNLLPLITIVLFLIQTKLFMPPPTDDQQRVAQRMMTIMMVFMSVLFFKVPAGLCLYFITSSIWGMVERALLPKSKLATDVQSEAPLSEPAASRAVQRVGQR